MARRQNKYSRGAVHGVGCLEVGVDVAAAAANIALAALHADELAAPAHALDLAAAPAASGAAACLGAASLSTQATVAGGATHSDAAIATLQPGARFEFSGPGRKATFCVISTWQRGRRWLQQTYRTPGAIPLAHLFAVALPALESCAPVCRAEATDALAARGADKVHMHTD